jgi:alkylation response protein AidB-like acyl-CoA dehydrogenase
MTYNAPIADIRFALDQIVGFNQVIATGAYDGLDQDLVETVLAEAAKLAGQVMAPLNSVGDAQGARLEADGVKTAPGFAAAYRAFVDGGWNAVPFAPDHGGQGLPWTLAIAIQEMWHASNMALGLCPMLSQGAVEAISAHGDAAMKARYLDKLVSGEWTGTMNLTEPQAGSDVGALSARAVKQGDGSYRIFGTKIYITYGDHDMAENILHLVLARLPDAPIGTRGISLFLVPKFLVNDDGSLGARNDAYCVGIEHKLGIHGSPTCTMAYGEKGGAIGYLIGAENRGMACMFTMMNNARLSVGLQGVAIAERAFQQALAYANERRQGKPFGLQHDVREMIPIVAHPDVRRMLLTMKSTTASTRAICYATAVALDLSRTDPDEAAREGHRNRADLLTPIAKGFSTDMGVEMASLGVQIHGGAGFVEQTGAAQHLRDARIAPIYEGTNGIQAIDLATRKVTMNGGAAIKSLIDDLRAIDAQARHRTTADFTVIVTHLGPALDAFAANADWLIAQAKSRAYEALAGATPFLRQAGLVIGGAYLVKGAIAAADLIDQGDARVDYLTSKIALARFFVENMTSQAAGLTPSIQAGSDPLYAIDSEILSA